MITLNILKLEEVWRLKLLKPIAKCYDYYNMFIDLIFNIIKFQPFLIRNILPKYFLKIICFAGWECGAASYHIQSYYGHFLNDNFTWRLTRDIL